MSQWEAKFTGRKSRASRAMLSLYANIGAVLSAYDLDADTGELVIRQSFTLPGAVQYAWPHVSRHFLYVASSDGGSRTSGGTGGDNHHLSALRIDPRSGELTPHGEPVRLRHRPIHVTTDVPSRHALVAYNLPSSLSVHRINPDGTLGGEVPQPALKDGGSYAHQVRVSPDNRLVILVTRGYDATPNAPEIPGALKTFRYEDGALEDEVSIAPGQGFGFGPRHLDFHRSKPWIYVSLERQNKLCMFEIDGDRPVPKPLFIRETLAEPGRVMPRQMTGAVHLHSNGRFVYAAERADQSPDSAGHTAYRGGENTIVTFAIDQATGKPTLIDRAQTRGIHPRTFAIDPAGRILVAAARSPMTVSEAGASRMVPASLDMFRIGTDGKLSFMRKYDVDASKAPMFWVGIVDRGAT